MAYGSINVPGVSGPELEQVRTLAQEAKDMAGEAQKAVALITSTINVEPSQSGSLTYTGGEQTPKWSGYDPNTLAIGGTTKATNAGTYTATFTPKEGYNWSDGTRSARSATWKINKAAGSLTLNKTSLALDAVIKTGTVTATRSGNGAISAVSDKTSVATVSVSGTTITVTAKGNGTATITVSCAAGTNHNAPASRTISVTVQMASATLADNDPATIQAAAQSGQAANLWSVGDKVPVAVSGKVGSLSISGTYYAFILEFDHNSSVEGENSIHFQFGKDAGGHDIAFADAGYGKEFENDANARFTMNTAKTNSGGWAGSYMRNTVCNAFLDALQTEWQDVIAACTKYNVNANGKVVETEDYIWLLAEFEVFGSSASSTEQDYQKQYDYYKNGNSKIKNKHNNTGTPCSWGLRSAHAGDNTAFRSVHTNGSVSINSADYSLAFAPGFMVA